MARTKRKVRNYLVVLVVRKSGAGKHQDRKKAAKEGRDLKTLYKAWF